MEICVRDEFFFATSTIGLKREALIVCYPIRRVIRF